MKRRAYRMKKRADSEAQMRLRITRSIVALHGTLGPSRTSISSIAKHARVPRSTVYRHFPNEEALFTASTGHWLAANPFPDLRPWAPLQNRDERLRMVLRELYPYYRKTQRMFENVLRDEETMPILNQMLGGYRRYVGDARKILMQGHGQPPSARRRIHAALGHALAFLTWRSLAVDQELNDNESAELMILLCRANSK
ncbi:MAG TPA: helix-turn-helix domain-containing protein [Bryobacteraceae bacterium]|jgi:AcrR family transcriptional regulator|nr:helix-turn-helix domain-containing protein [Bryobacteraceae bacterium]